jgi:hypothetical protein
LLGPHVRKTGANLGGSFYVLSFLLKFETGDLDLCTTMRSSLLEPDKYTEILVFGFLGHATSLETIKVSSADLLSNHDSYNVAAHASRSILKIEFELHVFVFYLTCGDHQWE